MIFFHIDVSLFTKECVSNFIRTVKRKLGLAMENSQFRAMSLGPEIFILCGGKP